MAVAESKDIKYQYVEGIYDSENEIIYAPKTDETLQFKNVPADAFTVGQNLKLFPYFYRNDAIIYSSLNQGLHRLSFKLSKDTPLLITMQIQPSNSSSTYTGGPFGCWASVNYIYAGGYSGAGYSDDIDCYNSNTIFIPGKTNDLITIQYYTSSYYALTTTTIYSKESDFIQYQKSDNNTVDINDVKNPLRKDNIAICVSGRLKDNEKGAQISPKYLYNEHDSFITINSFNFSTMLLGLENDTWGSSQDSSEQKKYKKIPTQVKVVSIKDPQWYTAVTLYLNINIFKEGFLSSGRKHRHPLEQSFSITFNPYEATECSPYEMYPSALIMNTKLNDPALVLLSQNLDKAQTTYTAMKTDTLLINQVPMSLPEGAETPLSKLRKNIIYWYVHGLWTESMLQEAVIKNIFTQEEINKIILDN